MENIMIPIKLTERDIKKMALEQQWGKRETKITLAVWLLLIIFSIFVLPFFASSIATLLSDLLFPIKDISSSSVFFLAFLLLIIMSEIVYFQLYAPVKIGVKYYQKSLAMQETKVVVLSKENIRVYSSHGMALYYWDELYKVDAYPSGFYIRLSSIWALPIPRRCFVNPAQLSLFTELVTAHVNANKLSLSDLPLIFSSPDLVPDDMSQVLQRESAASFAHAKEEPSCAPLISLHYHISKNEYVAGCMQMLLFHPLRFTFVFLGLLSMIVSFVMLHASTADFATFLMSVFFFFFGFFFAFVMPLQRFLGYRKAYVTDKRWKKESHVTIFADGINTECEESYSKYAWKDIMMIRSNAKFLEIYVSSLFVVLIPKRSFASSEEWQQILIRKRQYDGFKVKPKHSP